MCSANREAYENPSPVAWMRSAPTSLEVSAASNSAGESDAMSASAAAVRRAMCSRTDASKSPASSSTSGTSRIWLGSFRTTASGGAMSLSVAT